ncbi:putative Protodermal factor 1.3 [Hibiscus syriacus]|uniref:Protodermal factor 1.3 n=1 Tax=Hibiscus syriacus TaxID=106335 RepID=A0A6A2XEN7_HIBSY|nr:putative Protodermal factor 1.3 [Hibiscus syriacus]
MLNRGTKLKAWHVPQKYPIVVPDMFLVSVSVALVLLFRKNDAKPWNRFVSLVQFDPRREFRNGTDLIWQIPDSPKAVLFLAHGYGLRAVDFWERSIERPECVGLPEDRLLVLHALARKFAVLTISSAGKCWTFEKERLVVEDIITWWVKKHNLGKLPLVALGASSEDYPPTLFVHMPKDTSRKWKITNFMGVLRSKGVDVAEIECMELPLSPTFLSDRIRGFDQTVSGRGFVDENGYMKQDGRVTPWKDALRDSKINLLEKDLMHPVDEDLNLAFAYHEMTSLQSDEIFKWFESHMN